MKIMLLDGNSLINRAFYGVRLLSNKDGLFTNAIYGFLSTYFKLIGDENPDKIIACFDVSGGTFRHKEFAQYKAGRSAMPDELRMQFPILKELLSFMGVPICELEGYEADDIIGTFSAHIEGTFDECIIVTGDKDALQLITDKVTVKLVTTKAGTTNYINYTPDYFKEIYGFEPIKMIDLKALMGDKSDNIPGVMGIGEKTATNLLLDFGTLDGIYENIESDKIKKGAREKLKADKEMATKSYWLATIDKNVPIPFPTAEIEVNQEALYNLLMKLEFKNFIPKFKLEKEEKELVKLNTIVIDIDERLQDIINLSVNSEYVVFLNDINLNSLSFLIGDNIYIVLRENHSTDAFNDFINKFFAGNIKIISFDMRNIIMHMQNASGFIFDITLCAYLLDPSSNNYKLDTLALGYLSLKSAAETYNNTLLIDDEHITALSQNTLILSELYKILSVKIKDEKMETLLTDIEMKLTPVLTDMQKTGFLVDKKSLIEFSAELETRINELTDVIYNLAGEQFNINSPKILQVILFEKLGLTGAKKTKTGFSTNIEVLEFLKDKHPIIEPIIQYRTLSKLKSTYADGLTKFIHSDGRIHSHFNQTIAATGRLSSTDPNLQNIPIRKDIGALIRSMFIADTNKVLVIADYSQIELRILADIACDTEMINAFKNNEDIHTLTAAKVFGVDISAVSPDMRASAKAVNFGIVYGISEFSLACDIGVSVAQAKEYIQNYLDKYSGIKAYMANIKLFALENGYVETIFGRRRYIPEINSKNFNIRSGAERIALNTPIQGSSADIIKIAMINIYEKLKTLDAKIILQVHDELIIECSENISGVVSEILSSEMQNAYIGKVPLTADSKTSRVWSK